MTFLLTWSIFVRMSFDRSADNKKENVTSKKRSTDKNMESGTVNTRMTALQLTSVMQRAVPKKISIAPSPAPTEGIRFPGDGVGREGRFGNLRKKIKKCMKLNWNFRGWGS